MMKKGVQLIQAASECMVFLSSLHLLKHEGVFFVCFACFCIAAFEEIICQCIKYNPPALLYTLDG